MNTVPGWMGQGDLDVIDSIAKDQMATDFSVLEIGSFVGRSTVQWFNYWKTNCPSAPSPKVFCIDPFSYKAITSKGRENLLKIGYTVDWNGSMEKDFVKNTAGYNVRYAVGHFPSVLPPEDVYNVIFIDTKRTYENMILTLKAAMQFATPKVTLVCGPHYDTKYAYASVVAAVGEAARQMNKALLGWNGSTFWGFTA